MQTRKGTASGFAQWDWSRWRVSFSRWVSGEDDPWRRFILVLGPLMLSWSWCVDDE